MVILLDLVWFWPRNQEGRVICSGGCGSGNGLIHNTCVATVFGLVTIKWIADGAKVSMVNQERRASVGKPYNHYNIGDIKWIRSMTMPILELRTMQQQLRYYQKKRSVSFSSKHSWFCNRYTTALASMMILICDECNQNWTNRNGKYAWEGRTQHSQQWRSD